MKQETASGYRLRSDDAPIRPKLDTGIFERLNGFGL